MGLSFVHSGVTLTVGNVPSSCASGCAAVGRVLGVSGSQSHILRPGEDVAATHLGFCASIPGTGAPLFF